MMLGWGILSELRRDRVTFSFVHSRWQYVRSEQQRGNHYVYGVVQIMQPATACYVLHAHYTSIACNYRVCKQGSDLPSHAVAGGLTYCYSMQYGDLTCYHSMQYSGVNYSCLSEMKLISPPTVTIIASHGNTQYHTVPFLYNCTQERKNK
jgi:hypothetical protein